MKFDKLYSCVNCLQYTTVKLDCNVAHTLDSLEAKGLLQHDGTITRKGEAWHHVNDRKGGLNGGNSGNRNNGSANHTTTSESLDVVQQKVLTWIQKRVSAGNVPKTRTSLERSVAQVCRVNMTVPLAHILAVLQHMGLLVGLEPILEEQALTHARWWRINKATSVAPEEGTGERTGEGTSKKTSEGIGKGKEKENEKGKRKRNGKGKGKDKGNGRVRGQKRKREEASFQGEGGEITTGTSPGSLPVAVSGSKLAVLLVSPSTLVTNAPSSGTSTSTGTSNTRTSKKPKTKTTPVLACVSELWNEHDSLWLDYDSLLEDYKDERGEGDLLFRENRQLKRDRAELSDELARVREENRWLTLAHRELCEDVADLERWDEFELESKRMEEARGKIREERENVAREADNVKRERANEDMWRGI
jgi:hypothetical protein